MHSHQRDGGRMSEGRGGEGRAKEGGVVAVSYRIGGFGGVAAMGARAARCLSRLDSQVDCI